ncbi:hypothetical protein [Parvibaculum sp.]|uniref:ParB/RepB/Spo0J family partition protein n=1 Tax=Parvibaculum sp. TaxID=2024848 RepID=UPI0026096CDA|nr:hypothetical protein [Parvibaculum sp.]MCW5727215.1 ParB N-terminal domain-containing protein [Parvibaculum sp.]
MTRFDKPNEARAKALEADIKQAGLSARALGRLSGVDDKQIRNVLNRRDVPLDATWARLAAALPGALQASGRAEPKAKSGASRAPDSKLVALLVKQGIDIPAPAPASPASAHGVRRDDPADIALLAHNELVPGDNYRKTFTQAEIEQLAESIAERGLLQNIVARLPDGARMASGEAGSAVPGRDAVSSKNPARITGGERRWRAIAFLIGQGRWDGAARNIPVRLRAMDDAEARAVALIENLQRQDVPVLEEAEGFKALTALGWDTEKIAAACHIAQRTVQDRLTLFDRLKPLARAALEKGEVTLDQARAICTLTDEAGQNELVTAAVKRGYSGDALRVEARRGKPPVSAAAFDLKQYKGEFLGTGAGRVFADKTQFDRLQRKAAQKQVAALEASGAYAKVTLLPAGGDLDWDLYDDVWDPADAEDDATMRARRPGEKPEALVGVQRWNHKIEVQAAWPAAPETDGEDEAAGEAGEAGGPATAAGIEARERARGAREAAQRELAAQREQARGFLQRMIAAAQKNPARLLKHRILYGLTSGSPGHDGAAQLLPEYLAECWIDNLPATAEVLAGFTEEAWSFTLAGSHGGDSAVVTADPGNPGATQALPRNETLGFLTGADAARLAAFLDGASDRDILALYAALDASRCQLFHSLSLGEGDIALAEDLGVEVPDFMRPAADEEDEEEVAEDAA